MILYLFVRNDPKSIHALFMVFRFHGEMKFEIGIIILQQGWQLDSN